MFKGLYDGQERCGFVGSELSTGEHTGGGNICVAGGLCFFSYGYTRFAF